MKKNTILYVLVLLLAGGYLLYSNLTANSMMGAETVESTSFSIDMPKAYYEDEERYYINDKTDTIIEWYYFDNELGLDAEGMLYAVEYTGFAQGDFISVEEVEIDGTESYLAEYITFTTGYDGVTEYCDEGIIIVVPLENEFLVLDFYKWTEKSMSSDKNITDSEMKLFKEIAATIEITDDDYDNVDSSPATLTFATLSVDLNDLWTEDTGREAGIYDFGYFGAYTYDVLPIWFDVKEYDPENSEDVSYAADGALENYQYTYVGEGTIKGEVAYLYAYDAYTTDGSTYYYGVYAVGEHVYADVYFSAFEDGYDLTEDAQQKMAELILALK